MPCDPQLRSTAPNRYDRLQWQLLHILWWTTLLRLWTRYARKTISFHFFQQTLRTLGGNAPLPNCCDLLRIRRGGASFATPFGERLRIIQERSRNGDTATKILCVEGLQSALDDRTIHMMSGQTYGNRIAPTP